MSHLKPIEQYRAFLVARLADAIAKAWNGLAPGSVTWGLGHDVVAYNRRAVYADGSARMYGATNVPEFRGIEGYEDHDVNTRPRRTIRTRCTRWSCTSCELATR